MTKEQLGILKMGNDLLIANIGQTINSSPEEKKQDGRDYLKKVIEAGEQLDKIKTTD